MTAHPSLADLVERGADDAVRAHLAACAACRARARLVVVDDEPVDAALAESLATAHQRGAAALSESLTRGTAPPPDDDDELEPGRRLDRWIVEARLGAGGMGVVYRVRHVALGSAHALKLLPGASRALRQRLLREGRVQGQLRHPNVVAVSDVVDVDGAPGLVMELVEGPTLAALLRERAPLPPAVVDALAVGILRGVAAAHRAGLVHRDLKPGNVLVVDAGGAWVPKVADFGLARGTDDDEALTRSQGPLGTPAYMAPEQIRDARHADARSDVFSLGALLYELVSGVRAFGGGPVVEVYDRIRAGDRRPLRAVAPGAPARWVDAIERALSLDPADRFPDAAGLLAAWEGAAEAPPRRASAWWVSGAGAVAAAVVVALAVGRPAPVVVAPEAPPPLSPSAPPTDRRITARPSDSQIFSVTVSPDGSAVAWTDAHGVRRQLVDGGDPVDVLTEGPFHDVDWFPDGGRLLLHGTWRGADGVWSTDLDGARAEHVADGDFAFARLSPDGARVLLVDGAGAWVQDLADGTRRKLRAATDGMIAGVAWAPSGRSVAVVRQRPEGPTLEVIPLDGGAPRALLTDPRLLVLSLASLLWLPPDRLVYGLSEGGSSRWMGLDGAESAADAAGAVELRRWEGLDVTHADATPDGRRVVYARVTAQSVPWVLSLAGEPAPRRLADEGWHQTPLAWGDADTVWAQSSRAEGEVVRLPLAGGLARTVRDHVRVVRRMDRVGDAWVWLESRGAEGLAVTTWPDGGAPVVVPLDLPAGEAAHKRQALRCRTTCVLGVVEPGGGLSFARLDPASGARTPLAVPLPDGVTEAAWDLSPDGGRLAVATAGPRLAIHDLATGAVTEWPVTVRAPTEIAWNAAGDAVFVAGLTWRSDAYRLEEVGPRGSRTWWTSASWYGYRPTPSPDGRHLAFAVGELDDDLWITGGLAP